MMAKPDAVAESLRSIKRDGVAHIQEIAQGEPDPVFCAHYLSDCIRYDFGEPEMAGLKAFHALLFKHGFAGPPAASFDLV